jgi:hypothetical protein
MSAIATSERQPSLRCETMVRFVSQFSQAGRTDGRRRRAQRVARTTRARGATVGVSGAGQGTVRQPPEKGVQLDWHVVAPPHPSRHPLVHWVMVQLAVPTHETLQLPPAQSTVTDAE